MKVVDTDFLIDVTRGRLSTQQYFAHQHELVTTQINMYELIRGFFLEHASPSTILLVSQMFEAIHVLPVTDQAIIRAAEISANLETKGNYLEDADCLIAGICLAHGIKTIVTRNKKHFERIPELSVETYP